MSVNKKTHGQKYTHQSWVKYGGAATKMAAEGWIFNGDHTSSDAAHKAGSAQVGRYERQQRGSGRTLQYHVTAHGEKPPGPISQYSAHSLRDANGVRHGDAMKNPGLEAAAAAAHAQHSPLATVHATTDGGKTDVHNHTKGTVDRFNDLQTAHNVADRMRGSGAKGGAAVMHGDAHSKYVVVSMADAQRLEKAGHKWADHPNQAHADAAAHARNEGSEHFAKGMQAGHEKAYAAAKQHADERSKQATEAGTKALQGWDRGKHAEAKDLHTAAAMAHQTAIDAAKTAGLPTSEHARAIGVHQGSANAHRDAEARSPMTTHSSANPGLEAAAAKAHAQGHALGASADRDRLVTVQHATKGAPGEKIPPRPVGQPKGAIPGTMHKAAAPHIGGTGMHNPALEKLAAQAHAQRSGENAGAARLAAAKQQGGGHALQTGAKGGTYYTSPTGRKIYTKK